jgi:sodium/potassium/calcium exchanger 6
MWIELMTGEMEYVWYILLACLLAGSIAAVTVLYTATDGSHTAWRMVRCFGGFTCSMVWIAAIADEVVSVLQVSNNSDEDGVMGSC